MKTRLIIVRRGVSASHVGERTWQSSANAQHVAKSHALDVLKGSMTPMLESCTTVTIVKTSYVAVEVVVCR